MATWDRVTETSASRPIRWRRPAITGTELGCSGNRGVVESLPRADNGQLATSALVAELLGAPSWQERLWVLRANPVLSHQTVADRCRAEDADQLARFIERTVAVGLDVSSSELDVLEALESIEGLTSLDAAAVLKRGASALTTGAVWMLPEWVGAAEASGQAHLALSETLRELTTSVLSAVTGVQPAAIRNVIALACMEWEDVWPLLDSLVGRDDLFDALPAALTVATVSADVPQLGEWTAELRELLNAAVSRGPEAAQEEHQMRRLALSFAQGNGLDEFEDPAAVCAQLTGEMSIYVQRTGAVWLVPAAIDIARQAVERTVPESPLRAGRLSNLSGLIAEGIQVGVCPAREMADALRAAKEAFDIGSTDPAVSARLAANLGNRISQAVDTGLSPTEDLSEAVELHGLAWELTSPEDSELPRRASNLSALIANAFEAGLLTTDDLKRSLNLQDEAIAASEPDGPDLPWYLSNRANRVAQGVRYLVLPPESLLDGIADLRRAMSIAGPGHPSYVGVLSNLSSLLSEAVHAGVLSGSSVPEAISLAEQAFRSTPVGSPDWPRYANNLAIRLGTGVAMGFERLDRLPEAVEIAQQAVDATPATHGAMAGRIATLIGRVLAAIDAGVIAPARLTQLVGVGESMWLRLPSAHPLRAKLANDVAVLLSEAVKLGLLDPSRLVDAVAIAEEGLEGLSSGSPDWSDSASNLGAILSEAVHHGVVPGARLVEAVAVVRAAFESASASPSRAGLATNASALIAEAISAGLLEAGDLEQALELQQEALDLVPFPHPDRPAYIANLVQRLADAVAQGTISVDEARDRVSSLVVEAWEQAVTCVTPPQRRRVLELSGRLVSYAPLLLLRLAEDPVEAVVAIETLRGHLLRGLRAPHLESGQVSVGCESRYASAAAQYNASQFYAADEVGTFSHAVAAHDALLDAMSQVKAENPSVLLGERPSADHLLSVVPQGSVLVYLVVGAESALSQYPGAAIILGPEVCTWVDLPNLMPDAVVVNVGAVMSPDGDLDEVCSWLGETVMQPLLAAADEGPLAASTWKFVTTGLLGMLPLHAATVSGRLLDDMVNNLTVRSALNPESHRPGVQTAAGVPVAMAPTADDLPFAAADMAVARELLPDCLVLDHATQPRPLMSALTEAPSVVLSGHAVHALDTGGSLRLGGAGSELWLTADDVSRLPLRRRGVAVLAACSSGQSALSLPGEAIGLPTALLSVGMSAVVATLWPVRDSVAFVTIARFFQLKRAEPSMDDGAVLQATRSWLRRSSCAQLLSWLEQLQLDVPLDAGVSSLLRQEWEGYPDLAEPFPYADARDWAAFFCVGVNAPFLGEGRE